MLICALKASSALVGFQQGKKGCVPTIPTDPSPHSVRITIHDVKSGYRTLVIVLDLPHDRSGQKVLLEDMERIRYLRDLGYSVIDIFYRAKDSSHTFITMPARELPEKFLIAFFLAGEQRELVRAIAEAVENELGQATVFFDEWFECLIAGRDTDLINRSFSVTGI